MEINWEVGKAYITRSNDRMVCDKAYPRYLAYPIECVPAYGRRVHYREDGRIHPHVNSPLDIVGEWEEPNSDALDAFAYKSPPANKTYIVPLPEKVIAEMKKYDDLRKATTREMAKALCIPKELMVEPPGMISDVKLYRKAMFCGPLNEQKAPPTITNENWEGMCEKLLGKGSVTVGNALMIDRDNKTDDRRPFKMFRNPHYKRDVAAANLSLYRHKHSIWPHVVAERAADKPDSSRDSRPWYERV